MVHLIKRDPVPDLSLQCTEHGLTVLQIKVNHFPVGPGTIFRHQMIRHFKVIQGNHGFDPLRAQFIHHGPVVPDPLLIGLFLVTHGIDPGPVHRDPQCLKPHLGKETNVLPVPMVKINSPVGGVILSLLYLRTDFPWNFMGAAGHQIHNSGSLSALLPSALTLMGRYTASP